MSAKTTKQATKKAPRTARAGTPRRVRGNLSKSEITPLVLEAKAAYTYQEDLGNLEPGVDFDTWRRNEVRERFGKAGISALHHNDWRDVMAHFAILAGKDEKAIDLLLRAGKVKDHGDVEDTHERRDQLAHLVIQEIRDHAARPATWGGGYLTGNYFLTIARSKFAAKLARLDELSSKLTAKQLTQLLATTRNRIAKKEGRANESKRQPGKERRRRAAKATKLALDTPAAVAKRGPGDEIPF